MIPKSSAAYQYSGEHACLSRTYSITSKVATLWTKFLEEFPSVTRQAAIAALEHAKVVGRSLPFHRTTDPCTKFEPNTVKVKAAPPTVVLVGERLVIAGMAPPGVVPLGTVDAPEPQPQMLAPMATAISTLMGTNLRMPIGLMMPS